MDVQTILESIGLTKNEIKIYLSLLKLGSSSSGAIIKKTGIHTSKVYDGLERLASKGLVTHIIIANIKHFKAVDPDRLIDFLEDKKKNIELQEEEIKKYLPELKLTQTLDGDDTEAEIFRGWKGLETVFNEGIKEMGKGDIWYVLGAYEGEDKERTNNFIQKVILKCELKKMKWKVIYNESARNTFKYEQESKITENRFLAQETPATINIYKDVVFIALWIKNPIAFRVKNQKVADSFKTYFKFMWALAKP
ncbi:MAG: helix-turn-helix domain-containing protein [Candidatus Woesearchaeota archaeon]